MGATVIADWQIYGLIIGGLGFGFWIGITHGRRNALRDLYRRIPESRNDMLHIGLEDPATPWWKWRRSTYVYLSLVAFMFLAALPSMVNEPATAALPPTNPTATVQTGSAAQLPALPPAPR